MVLLRFLIPIIVIALIAFLVTQVLIPLLSRSVLFPMFRRTRTETLAEIQETRAQIVDEELKDTLEDLQEQLKAKQADDQPTEPTVDVDQKNS